VTQPCHGERRTVSDQIGLNTIRKAGKMRDFDYAKRFLPETLKNNYEWNPKAQVLVMSRYGKAGKKLKTHRAFQYGTTKEKALPGPPETRSENLGGTNRPENPHKSWTRSCGIGADSHI
jgi:hypothetical protein